MPKDCRVVRVVLLAIALRAVVCSPSCAADRSELSLPIVDLDARSEFHTVVDREPGQYLGHPTTCLLEDGKTILCVYPKGHGKGPIVYKRSQDGGVTWSDRLSTPASWATSQEVPTIHRVIDAQGKKRLILWSGLYPARLAWSDDDGISWSELQPAGDWGGIVVMGAVVERRGTLGSYQALFHDDGRFFRSDGRLADPVQFTLYQTRSEDGGLHWSQPRPLWTGNHIHLCEPGIVRSPDGQELACLLRENRRVQNAHIMFSTDEGETWSEPRPLPLSLTGDRHVGQYGPDGRLVISFRDRPPQGVESPTAGDWVAWVGTYDDLRNGKPGAYRVRIKDNHHDYDCAYPGVEVLADGTFVLTTYGHWTRQESPYVLCTRFKLAQLDSLRAP